MRYICNNCDFETDRPERIVTDDGFTMTIEGYACPKCHSVMVEEMEVKFA